MRNVLACFGQSAVAHDCAEDELLSPCVGLTTVILPTLPTHKGSYNARCALHALSSSMWPCWGIWLAHACLIRRTWLGAVAVAQGAGCKGVGASSTSHSTSLSTSLDTQLLPPEQPLSQCALEDLRAGATDDDMVTLDLSSLAHRQPISHRPSRCSRSRWDGTGGRHTHA
jgi:hypothetical protein